MEKFGPHTQSEVYSKTNLVNKERMNRRRMIRDLGLVGLMAGAGIVGGGYLWKRYNLSGFVDFVFNSEGSYNAWEQSEKDLESKIGKLNQRLRNLENPIEIYTYDDLIKIGKDKKFPLNGTYVLMSDIDFLGKPYFEPIGSNELPFTGVFNGNGFFIKNLRINRSEQPAESGTGFFGYVSGEEAIVANLNFEKADVHGFYPVVGVVAGYNTFGNILSCNVEGDVYGKRSVGKVVGYNNMGIINSSSSKGLVIAEKEAGGICGFNAGFVTYCTVDDSIIEAKEIAGSITGVLHLGDLLHNTVGPMIIVKTREGNSERTVGLDARRKN